MKYEKTLLHSIFIIIIVTSFFFAINTIFVNLDENYFQEHKEELTTVEIINDSNGEITNNYYYADTPYFKIGKFFFWVYLIVPVLVVVVLSRKYILKKKNYAMSLLLPFSFIVLTFLLQVKNMYDAIGWEKNFMILLIFIYTISSFILVSIINMVLLKKKK